MDEVGFRTLVLVLAWVFVSSVGTLLLITASRAFATDPIRRLAAFGAILSGVTLVLLLVTARTLTPPRPFGPVPVTPRQDGRFIAPQPFPGQPGQPGPGQVQPPQRPGGGPPQPPAPSPSP